MTDPVGLIGGVGGTGRVLPGAPTSRESAGGASFKQMLQDQIEAVNKLQSDAQGAIEDLASNRRNDLEGVMLATQKADTAFKLLLQVRNKVMEAYDEIKQIRV